LIECQQLLELDDIWVHGSHVLRVDEDECLLWVEPTSNDIFCVLSRKTLIFLMKKVSHR
jgi:hypothetical protein